MREVWRKIPGARDYAVSDLGRARSHRSGVVRMLRPSPVAGPMRYLRITIIEDSGRKVVVYLHQIVLAVFCGPRPAGLLALHRDGVVNNCALSNLYWGTYEDNVDDKIRHGWSGRGERNPNAKLSSDDITDIRRLYSQPGVRQADLAEQFGVKQAHISRIVRGVSWKEAA